VTAFFVLEETLTIKKRAVDERVPLLPNGAIEDENDDLLDENTIDSVETAIGPERPPSSLFSLIQEKSVWGIVLFYCNTQLPS
jgi:hypothetical protein